MRAAGTLDRILALDFETSVGDEPNPREVGAVLGEERAGRRIRDGDSLADIEELARASTCLLGHNLLDHDLRMVRRCWPESQLLCMPVVDTLLLSPIAHPERPYHALVKDYKLVRAGKSDPRADAELALGVFSEQRDELVRRYPASTGLLSVFRTWFAAGAGLLADRGGQAHVFESLGGEHLEPTEIHRVLLRELADLVCRSALMQILASLDESAGLAMCYAVAWVRVSGTSSVLPSFVRKRFPAVPDLVRRLRDVDCRRTDCAWCREQHDARGQLQRWFGFEDFRADPADDSGRSLQRRIVEHAMAGGSHLSILPTGGGKSLCFQLPALIRSHRRGALTIVLSPLQALMKDQVAGLERRTDTSSVATLNGLLTPPERARVLEGVRMGDVSILYVSPEQLRNTSFVRAIRSREIGAWVFDEAHCLSKWGHDFRPDYLHAGRFIRETAQHQGVPVPPIECVTATARQEVRDEIVRFFATEVHRELELFEGGVARDNLRYRVEQVRGHDKKTRVFDAVTECLTVSPAGCAIVYHSTRRKADEMAAFLAARGLPAEAYHAGLPAPERKRVQDDFVAGSLKVICATNAFGMGVDKENVRLVVHAEIPGSLENYVQEAGRAGRDRAPADALLLYDPEDLETQFRIASGSRLTLRDLQQLLRGLKRAKRKAFDELVVTAGELLRDESVDTSFDIEDRDATTKVVTAISWLERAGFLHRSENVVRVFQGTPAMSVDDARATIAALELEHLERAAWTDLFEVLSRAEPDQPLTIDDLAGRASVVELARRQFVSKPTSARGRATGVAETRVTVDRSNVDPQFVTKVVLETFHAMAKRGLIRSGVRMTAFLRHKVKDPAQHRLTRVRQLEAAMIDVLREHAPDADAQSDGDTRWQVLSLRAINQALDPELQPNPQRIRRLLGSLTQDGRGFAGSVGSVELRQLSRDRYRCRLRRSWKELQAVAMRRQDVAEQCLSELRRRIPDDTTPSAELLVDFEFQDLIRAVESNLLRESRVKDPVAAIERALLFMHEHDVIHLQSGLAVFRSAMTIRFEAAQDGRRYTKQDYAPLAEHYEERNRQIHVMDHYAQAGVAGGERAAADFIRDYFARDRRSFQRQHMPLPAANLSRPIGSDGYARIVDALDDSQRQIVTAPVDQRQLVLAGPGSGKTRVVVHRCAWLLQVGRVRPEGILMLCFNRSTARELRARLGNLVGRDVSAVTIQTYDGFALRLVGRSLVELPRNDGLQTREEQSKKLDRHLAEARRDATAMLRGEREVSGFDGDALRDTMLAGYEHILVDEYQDIDASQYELIAAIAGLTSGDEERKLTILAVGDDDQNIYEWRGASTMFIRRFEQDYAATVRTLLVNYRSTSDIVEASSRCIARNVDRMKARQSLRSAPHRAAVGSGAESGRRDPVAMGRVSWVTVPSASAQAQVVADEIRRVKGSWPERPWSDFAVLGRKWRELDAVRDCLGDAIPCRRNSPRGMPSLFIVREVDAVLTELRRRRATSSVITIDELVASVAELRGGVESPWWDYAESLITDFVEDVSLLPGTGNHVVSVADVLDHAVEAVQLDRERAWFGDGVLLATAHSVKGHEFPFVFILDGEWQVPPDSSLEAERRLYYVAMTRAAEGLWLGRRLDASNPFVHDILGPPVVERVVPAASSTDRPLRHYAVLGLEDMYLDFASRGTRRVQEVLESMTFGDEVSLRRVGEHIRIECRGVEVAGLSRSGKDAWARRLDAIDRARVVCMVRWRSSPTDESRYREGRSVEEWLVPIVEIVWRGESP